MIKIKIHQMIFKPKFKCSLSIVAKIENQQFVILDQIPFNQNIQQLNRQFPIQSTIQLENSSKSSKNDLNIFINIILKAQSGKVKLASIKKNIHSISSFEQKEQEKLMNCHDKNAKIIYSIVFDSFNFNKNKNQHGKLSYQNNKNLVLRRFKNSEKQNDYRIQSRSSLKLQKIERKTYNNVWQRLSPQNKERVWLSPQIRNLRSLQAKRQESNQSKKTSRLSKAYNQQYKQWYLQTKDRMQIIQKKYIKSQQKVQLLQQQNKQLKRNKSSLEENNKNLEFEIKQKNQMLLADKKQIKKIKNILAQTQRENKRALQCQASQIQKLQYRQTLLREKLKNISDNCYEVQQQRENLQKEIKKLKEEINKKNFNLVQNQKKIQEQEKIQKAQLKTAKQKFREMEIQNNNLKMISSDLELKIKKYENQKEKLNQLQKVNQKMIEKSQKFTEQIQRQKKKNSQKVIQLTNQLKKRDQIIFKLQSKISSQEQEKIITKKMQDFTGKQNQSLKNEIQRISLLYKQSNQQLVNLKGIQDNLKNNLMRSTQKLQKQQKSLTTQIKRQQKQFQKQIEYQKAIIQQKEAQKQALKHNIQKKQQQNTKLKQQISILKQNLQELQAKNKGRILKQSTKLDELQSQKMIKFNLAQLSQYEKVQEQNKQLKKQIKKLQKSINQLREEGLQMKKSKIGSQSEIKIQNLKQSLSSIEAKQKLMKLAESTVLNQKAKQFQIQKINLVKKYQEREKQIIQKSKQINEKCKKMSKIIDQNKETIQDKQLIIVSFKTNLMKGLKYIEDIIKLINSVEKSQKLSPKTLISIRQTIKKLQAIISKVPKGVQVQYQQENLPVIRLSKPKSKNQLSKSQRSQSPNKSQLYLKPQKLDKDKEALNRSQVLLNISKSIFLNESFKSSMQESLKNSQQSCKSDVENILQEE